jgi:hypothetical protein
MRHKSSHCVHIDEPGLVVETIKDICVKVSPTAPS